MLKENFFKDDTTIHTLDRLNREVRLKPPCNEILIESALIILDMQKYFTDPASHAFVPSSNHIIKSINHLIKFFDKSKRPIIFTKHINNHENAGMMGIWWRDIITQENPLSSYTDELIKKQSIDIIKPQYDAFYNTELDVLLKKQNIKTLIICGVMTHLCLESTARSAFTRGYNVIIPVDSTTTYNYELYYSSLRSLAHGFSFITQSKELITK